MIVAIAVACLAVVVFLMPIGGDEELGKRVYPDRIETVKEIELWSGGTMFIFGPLSGENHLTKGTIAGGLLIATLLAASAYALSAMLTRRRSRHDLDRSSMSTPAYGRRH